MVCKKQELLQTRSVELHYKYFVVCNAYLAHLTTNWDSFEAKI